MIRSVLTGILLLSLSGCVKKRETVTSPTELAIGDSINPPLVGNIQLLDVQENHVLLKRTNEWKIEARPQRLSVGNGNTLWIDKIDKTNKTIRVKVTYNEPVPFLLM